MELSDALYSSMIKRGAIFISGAFKHIDHRKFFVVIGENEAQLVGFFYINSNVNPYIASNPERMAMQMYIKHASYPNFLTHGSFIDAHKLVKISKSDLTRQISSGEAKYCGELTSDDLMLLLENLRASPIYSKVEKSIFFT
jgi:hypothetical protein